jgi:hypothetical protein
LCRLPEEYGADRPLDEMLNDSEAPVLSANQSDTNPPALTTMTSELSVIAPPIAEHSGSTLIEPSTGHRPLADPAPAIGLVPLSESCARTKCSVPATLDVNLMRSAAPIWTK